MTRNYKFKDWLFVNGEVQPEGLSACSLSVPYTPTVSYCPVYPRAH